MMSTIKSELDMGYKRGKRCVTLTSNAFWCPLRQCTWSCHDEEKSLYWAVIRSECDTKFWRRKVFDELLFRLLSGMRYRGIFSNWWCCDNAFSEYEFRIFAIVRYRGKTRLSERFLMIDSAPIMQWLVYKRLDTIRFDKNSYLLSNRNWSEQRLQWVYFSLYK